MREIRNTTLPAIYNFTNLDLFKKHLEALLKLLYPAEVFAEHQIKFKHSNYKGITASIYSSCLYLELDTAYVVQNPHLKYNHVKELDALNVFFQYTASNNKVYLYPRDRDNFPDTPYGMEMRANYFVLVLVAALNYLEQIKSS